MFRHSLTPEPWVSGKIMSLSIGERAKLIVQSEIRNMTTECNKRNGINLAQGVCDTSVPQVVTDSADTAMREGINTYVSCYGLPELRREIAGKMKAFNGIEADPETEIVVSAGATGAFFCTCMALLNPGDEVIVFEPYYGYHVNTLRAVDAVPVYVRTNPPDWTFSAEDLARVVTPRTKAIVVCTPSNPSGKVLSRREIDMIADFAISHDIFIFTDEIYEYFVYDNARHISPGSIAAIADRTITISGYSKTFSITGWRIGYVVCREKWAQMIAHVNDLVYVCAPAPLQIGVACGIRELGAEFYSELIRTFTWKRQLICDTLLAIGIKPCRPEGAYYVLADVSAVPGRTSKDKAMYVLERTGVAGVPGSAFCEDGGEDLIRFCFAKSDEDIKRACEGLSVLADQSYVP